MCYLCMQANVETGQHPNHLAGAGFTGAGWASVSGGYNGHSGFVDVSTASYQATLQARSSALGIDQAVHTAALSSNGAALTDGSSWTGRVGTNAIPATVTYTFDDSQLTSDFVFATNTRQFTSSEQAATLGIFSKLGDITNLTFTEANNPATADITFYVGDITFSGVIGITGVSANGAQMLEASVGIDSSQIQFDTEGTDNYLTLLHEIGHSVGLKHPGNYGSGDVPPFLSSQLDNTDNTVMSYHNGTGGIPSNYRPFDIEALQYLYGTIDGGGDTSPGGGDTTPGGGDGGGGNGGSTGFGDPDSFFANLTATNTTTNGTDTDELIKAINSAGDGVSGGHGHDSVFGGAGTDTLFGGQGVNDAGDDADLMMGGPSGDLMYGNGGNDTLYGGYVTATYRDGADTIYGGFGADSIYGNLGDDSLIGGGAVADPIESADHIFGGFGNDTILGNGGNDTVSGGPGNDMIYGGFGGDSLAGEEGNDFFVGGPGNDTMIGGSGYQIYQFGNGDGVDVITDFGLYDTLRLINNIDGSGIHTAAQALAHMVISGGDAIFTFSADNTLTLTGITYGEIGLSNIQIY